MERPKDWLLFISMVISILALQATASPNVQAEDESMSCASVMEQLTGSYKEELVAFCASLNVASSVEDWTE